MYIPLHHIVIRDARRPRVAKEFSRIDESLREFIGEQAMFLVATAPHGRWANQPLPQGI